MSEPASLYARLTLDSDRHQAWLGSVPAVPADHDDWIRWLERKQMHGGVPAADALRAAAPAGASVGAVLQAWQSDKWLGMTPVSLDPQGRCCIVMLQASENYLDLIHLLAPLRGAAASTRPDADDFILVTDFLFDPSQAPMACLALSAGASRFVDEVPAAWRDEAFAAFEAALDHMQGLHAD